MRCDSLVSSVRKEIKIRPGFTPQEDVSRFRGTRQKQQDATALPKGHIIGWAPPPKAAAPANSAAGLSKSAKKNAKRKEKREAQKTDTDAKVKDNWEDDDEEEGEQGAGAANANKPTAKTQESQAAKPNDEADTQATDALTKKLEELDVR